MKQISSSNRSKTLPAVMLAAGLLFASTAMAAEHPANDFDANHDGQITFEEVMKKLEKSARTAFDAMDHNKDGVLSKKDFDDVREGMQKPQEWLHDLLKPFMKDDKSESGPMSV